MKYFWMLVLAGVAFGQEQKKTTRVFLTDQQSWLDSSNLVAPAQTYAPTRTEQIHNLTKYCPAMTITGDVSKADFVLVWTSLSYQQTRWGGHEHEWAIYNQQKDVLKTGAEYHMKNAAKDICKFFTAEPRPSPAAATH
jgi:hypothetical protein